MRRVDVDAAGDGAPSAGSRRDHRYDVFVSYSHSGRAQLAPAIQRGLRQLGKPWYRPPDLAVYRDQTSQSATHALWASLEQALSSSRWFLLLASPQAAASPWVSRELAWWLEHASSRQLLLALTDGEIVWDTASGDFDRALTTAVPEPLYGVFDEEPKWIDLRWADSPERLVLRHPQFRGCIADLAAPIRGVSKEALVDEDVRQQRRRVRWRNAAIGGLAVLTAVACVLAFVALNQRNTARRERDVATSRQLAVVSEDLQSTQPELALLVALQSVNRRPTDEAWAAVQSALSQPMHTSLRLVGHTEAISDAAISSSGNLAATSGGNGEVFVWRVSDGTRVAGPLQQGSDSIVYAVEISADDALVATGGSGGSVRLWRSADGSPAVDPMESGASVNTVSFSPDGTTLATGDNDGHLRLWDVRTGRQVGSVLADEAGVSDLAYTPTGDEIIVAGFSGDVRRWTTSTLDAVGDTISATADPLAVLSISVRADGEQLATVSGSGEGIVRLWDLPSGRPSEPAQLEATEVSAVDFSPDGTLLATVSGSVAQLWDIATGRDVGAPFSGSTDYLQAVAFSGDGQHLITGGGDRVARIWDVTTSQPIGRSHQVSDVVYDVALAPDGRLLAAGGSGQVTIQDLERDQMLASFPAAPGATTVAYSPDGSLIATGDIQGIARIWDTETHQQVGSDLNVETLIYDIAFTPDGEQVLTASFDGTLRAWGLPNGQLQRELTTGDIQGLSALSIDGAGTVVAAGDLGGPVRVWELSTGRLLASFDEGDEASTAVAFSRDGQLLVQGTSEGDVRIWDVAARRVECTLPGHEAWVEAAAFSPDGSLVATGGQDNTVRLWDPKRCRSAAAPIVGFRAAVSSLDFSSEGDQLFMGSIDGTVRTALVPSQWVRVACELAGRNMTDAEWARYIGGEPRATC